LSWRYSVDLGAETVLTVLGVGFPTAQGKHAMPIDWDQEVNLLQQGTVDTLRRRYAEVFGEPPPRTGNKTWLVRRILWRLQALAEGGLSERAQRQSALLANDADLRLSPPRSTKTPALLAQNSPGDPRLPKPGTVLNRRYKGQLHKVQ
jgi:hypothetical protein